MVPKDRNKLEYNCLQLTQNSTLDKANSAFLVWQILNMSYSLGSL
jgi:hypothetical protein